MAHATAQVNITAKIPKIRNLMIEENKASMIIFCFPPCLKYYTPAGICGGEGTPPAVRRFPRCSSYKE